MRIDPSDFTRLGTNPGDKNVGRGSSTDFVDTLKEALATTNEKLKESDRAAVDLVQGKSANIHETMITMQKADITLRLLISATNKLVDGYKQLMQLR